MLLKMCKNCKKDKFEFSILICPILSYSCSPILFTELIHTIFILITQ